MNPSRRLVHFSCGAASAVAAKLTLAKYPKEHVCIVNAFVAEEHSDNRRFLRDVEKWLEHPITVLRDEKYGASVLEVWRRERYIKGRHGASCARAVKRKVLGEFATSDDIHVIGFTAEEEDRCDDLQIAKAEFPLIEANLTKADCLAVIERAGLQLPEMYRLGFNNANCIGCCKGGMGYWNKVREIFPERFYQVADIQEKIGPGAYFFKNPNGQGRMRLRDLPLDAGRHDEPEISCSFFCAMAEEEWAKKAARMGLSGPNGNASHDAQHAQSTTRLPHGSDSDAGKR